MEKDGDVLRDAKREIGVKNIAFVGYAEKKSTNYGDYAICSLEKTVLTLAYHGKKVCFYHHPAYKNNGKFIPGICPYPFSRKDFEKKWLIINKKNKLHQTRAIDKKSV